MIVIVVLFLLWLVLDSVAKAGQELNDKQTQRDIAIATGSKIYCTTGKTYHTKTNRRVYCKYVHGKVLYIDYYTKEVLDSNPCSYF